MYIEEKELRNKLKQLCDKEFLDKLVEVARIGGWYVSSDYYEVANFIEGLYHAVDVEEPETVEPFYDTIIYK